MPDVMIVDVAAETQQADAVYCDTVRLRQHGSTQGESRAQLITSHDEQQQPKNSTNPLTVFMYLLTWHAAGCPGQSL